MAGLTVPRPDPRRAAAWFVEAAFERLSVHQSGGEEVPFAFDARRAGSRPALYDYRPLFRAYAQRHRDELRALPEARTAIEVLATDQAVVAAARDHAAAESDEPTAIYCAVLEPLASSCADASGGFVFDPAVFATVYERMIRDARRNLRSVAAFVPLVGLRCRDEQVAIGHGITLRQVTEADIAARWPEAVGLLPAGFGVDLGRRHAIELELTTPRGLKPLPIETLPVLHRVLTALRLLAGPVVGSGPLVFERVDWSPRAPHAAPPALSSVVADPPAKLESGHRLVLRGLLDCLERIEQHDPASMLALARYDLSLLATSPGARVAAMLGAIEPLLGADGVGPWGVAMRTAALVAGPAAERRQIATLVREAATLAGTGVVLSDAGSIAARLDGVVRSVLLAAVETGSRGLGDAIDDVLLGGRPRPRLAVAAARTA